MGKSWIYSGFWEFLPDRVWLVCKQGAEVGAKILGDRAQILHDHRDKPTGQPFFVPKLILEHSQHKGFIIPVGPNALGCPEHPINWS